VNPRPTRDEIVGAALVIGVIFALLALRVVIQVAMGI
jgi:hypothetical protein